MTLKETILDLWEGFIMRRKCVMDEIERLKQAKEYWGKQQYEYGKRHGYAEGYEQCEKDFNPFVHIKLEYGEDVKIGKSTFRPSIVKKVAIEDANILRSGDALKQVQVETAIEAVVRHHILKEEEAAEQTLIKKRVISCDTPATFVYKDALKRICKADGYIERCTNEFAEAIDNAKKVLALKFEDGVAEDTRTGGKVERQLREVL